MISSRVRDVMRDDPAQVDAAKTVLDAMVVMTRSKLGAVSVLNGNGSIHRIFTDGDLRRLLAAEGGDAISKSLSELPSNSPRTIESSATLQEASDLFRTTKVDTLIVSDNGKVAGMLDVQDIL
jgi:arabinose-5-phosphate isomerase